MQTYAAFFRAISCASGLLLTVGCGDDEVKNGYLNDGGAPESGSDAGDGSADAMVQRGQYLVEHVTACADCHTPRGENGAFDQTRLLAGVECLAGNAPVCLSSANLTNHETGLKNRSDQEVKDMFTRGERPDGTALHPFMPYWVLGNMSTADADAIVAYLRTVPGVDHTIPPNQGPFAPPPEPVPLWPENMIPEPHQDYPDQEAALRGRYLAGQIGVCMECHTPRDDQNLPLMEKAFQGGREFPAALLGLPPGFPELIYSANITPDESGISGWAVQDVVNALKLGQDRDQGGIPLCPPMPAGPMGAFGGLTDSDARDIGHYLLSLPPGHNVIPQDCSPPAPPDGGTSDASSADAGDAGDGS